MVSGHNFNLLMHAPLRWACELDTRLCGPAWHDAVLGRHMYTQWILDTFAWLQRANEAHPDVPTALFTEGGGALAAVAQVVVVVLLAVAYLVVFAWDPRVYATVAVAVVATTVLLRRRRATAASKKVVCQPL